MFRLLAVLMCLGFFANQSFGQFVPPIPDRVPASPAYEPPAPTRAPPPAAVEAKPQPPEKQATIVVRDANGKVVALDRPIEEAALMAHEMDEQMRAKVQGAMKSRRELMASKVIANAATLMKLRQKIESVDSSTTLDVLTTLAQEARPLAGDRLIEDMFQRRAISARYRTVARTAANEYRDALRQQVIEQYGHEDIQSLTVAGWKLTMDEMTTEPFLVYEDLMRRAAPRTDALLVQLNLTASQRAVINAVRQGSGDQVAKCKRIFNEVLDAAQKTAFLAAAFPELAPKDDPEQAG